MKRYLTVLVVLLSLSGCWHLTVSTAKAEPYLRFRLSKPRQGCAVGCTMSGACQVCAGGSEGRYCVTPDCNNCISSGGCELDIPQTVPSKLDTTKPFRLAPDVIREIAKVHPRFAATLANINVFGFDPQLRIYRVHWTPVEISSEDIEAFLDRSAHPGFFERYNQRGRELNLLIQKGSLEKILYDLTIESSNSAQVIKLSMRNDPLTITVDPPYSSLEMTLPHEFAVIDAIGMAKFMKAAWRIDSEGAQK